MNAGANGQETADAIDSVEIVTTDGDVQLLTRRDLVFRYRQSIFQGMEELAAILAVTFKLSTSVSARIRQQDYLQRRRRTQPIGERCAGSVFQNLLCSGMSAGELIEKAGLKAFKLGGTKVSEVHANFFINFDNSTSKDMLELIKFVKETVHRKLGVELEEEIRYVPYNVV